jgi:hypothetical protein
VVAPKTLYDATGEDMELKLTPPKDHGNSNAGVLTIRVRPATEEDKAQKKSFLSGFMKSASLPKNYGKPDLALLIEIVSCWNLPAADLNTSDPYVKVKIGKRDVHETKPISSTREPIYTIKTNSLFILDVATKEVTENQGITFKVKDYDVIGRNDDLGIVVVPAETILAATGERLEFQLKAPGTSKDAGFIAIRCRPATNYDREFLNCVAEGELKGELKAKIEGSLSKSMKPVKGQGRLKSLMMKKVKQGKVSCFLCFSVVQCSILLIGALWLSRRRSMFAQRVE